MTGRRLAIPAVTLVTMLLVQPISPPATTASPATSSADRAALVAGNNAFAFDLYRVLAAAGGGDLCFSPFSLAAALAMTHAGARGQTAAEMETVLHLPDDADVTCRGTTDLLAELQRADPVRDCRLHLANRLWAQQDLRLLAPFLQRIREWHGAGIETTDFAEPEAARRQINGWVAQQTNGRIADLIQPGILDEEVRLVLTNAIYFKAGWATVFNSRHTRPMPFQLSAERTCTVNMMHLHKEMRYAAPAGLQILELPYADDALSMVILLPADTDGLAALEHRLTAEQIDGWLSTLVPQRVQISLPRFDLDSRFELNRVLADLGMPSAFAPATADFSAMTGRRDLFISNVIHQGRIEVHEAGSEATAATAVIAKMGALPVAAVIFNADHPFVFMIRDRLTGSILFLGRLTDPGA